MIRINYKGKPLKEFLLIFVSKRFTAISLAIFGHFLVVKHGKIVGLKISGAGV